MGKLHPLLVVLALEGNGLLAGAVCSHSVSGWFIVLVGLGAFFGGYWAGYVRSLQDAA